MDDEIEVASFLTGLYLPREVFFGRLGFAGAFAPVCASDFGRFFPATSGSFRLMLPETLATAATRPDPVRDDLVDDAVLRQGLCKPEVTGSIPLRSTGKAC